MEILADLKDYSEVHSSYSVADRKPTAGSSSYRVDRDLYEFFDQKDILEFNPFDYLESRYRYFNIKQKVLDGGCGFGYYLEGLKKGINHKSHSYNGLFDKIYTTGITLTYDHAVIADKNNSPYKIDRMLIGPIQNFSYLEPQDFIIDFYGACYHFPEDALLAYGKILKEDSQAYIRAYTPTEKDITDFKELVIINRLEVLRESEKTRYYTDFVLYNPRRFVVH